MLPWSGAVLSEHHHVMQIILPSLNFLMGKTLQFVNKHTDNRGLQCRILIVEKYIVVQHLTKHYLSAGNKKKNVTQFLVIKMPQAKSKYICILCLCIYI